MNRDAVISDRTAIVHDWFQGYHGGERTVDAMRAGLFAPGSEPDIFTFYAAKELLPAALAAAIVHESRLARLPGIRQRGHEAGRWRSLLPYMPHYFERLDLHAYDVVISSSHACAVNVRPRADAFHACYCFTPMRYAWMPATDRRHVGPAKTLALRMIGRRLRRIDLEASRRPDLYVAISTCVRDRIRRFYGRDAVVVHPPVDVNEFAPGEKDGEQFLWVHRLIPYKQPELVVEAFRGLPHRLTMVGVGPLERRLRETLPTNVRLRGWLPRAELVRHYAEAAGFIHVGEEDFGITMVEALASGTPVIALDRGGARDIVRDDVDGVLISHPDVEAIRDAVRRVAAASWSPNELSERARGFSRERFLATLGAAVHSGRG